MKLLVVSDTHRKNDNYFTVVEQVRPDLVIHCGDAEGSEYALSESAGCPAYIVMGNNDFFSDLPREVEVDFCGKKIWATHGHNFYVSMTREHIKREAHAKGVDIVCYGHTHKPVVETEGGLLVINPGSLSYPRQEGRRPSYVVVELQHGKKPEAKIAYL
jgi:putative phosphoesterase